MEVGNRLKRKIICEGGEAIVFCIKFGTTQTAVRVQIFDAFLFSKQFDANKIKWVTHLFTGKLLFLLFLFNLA